MDDPEFLRRLARRCRDLRSRTTVEGIREHLELMAAELEVRAGRLELALLYGDDPPNEL